MPDLVAEDLAFPVSLLVMQDKADLLNSLAPQMQQGYSSAKPLGLPTRLLPCAHTVYGWVKKMGFWSVDGHWGRGR